MRLSVMLAAFVVATMSSVPALADEGAGPYPTPHYSCSDGAVRTPLRTFSLAYRPFPEPFAMFGAQLSEAVEHRLTERGLAPAPRADADVVLTIRYVHARVRSGASHHQVAFMLVGTCPSVSGNYFSTREDLLNLVDRYLRGEIATDSQSLVPHETH